MADKAVKLQSFQSAAQKAAVSELEKSPEILQKLIATSEQFFPTSSTLASVQQQFASLNVTEPNSALENAIIATMESIDVVLTKTATFQYYVTLTVPKIEDGGNFGVGIQLESLKTQSDYSDKLVKHLEELSKYHSTRADALEKLKFPSNTATKSVTKASSDGTSTGGEKGDGKTSSQSASSEEKNVETVTTISPLELSTRKAALVAVDLLFYNKAKVAFSQVILAFMTICSFMEKNADKIAKPKSESGSRGGYNAMY